MTPLSTFSAHLSVIVVYSLLPSNLNIPPWRCVCNAKKLSYSAGKRSIRGRYTVHARSWCTARQELNTHTHTHTHTRARTYHTHTTEKYTCTHSSHSTHTPQIQTGTHSSHSTHTPQIHTHTHHIPHTHTTDTDMHTLITFNTHTTDILITFHTHTTDTYTHSSHSTHILAHTHSHSPLRLFQTSFQKKILLLTLQNIAKQDRLTWNTKLNK